MICVRREVTHIDQLLNETECRSNQSLRSNELCWLHQLEHIAWGIVGHTVARIAITYMILQPSYQVYS